MSHIDNKISEINSISMYNKQNGRIGKTSLEQDLKEAEKLGVEFAKLMQELLTPKAHTAGMSESINLPCKLLTNTAKTPTRGTEKASCYDLYVDWIEVQLSAAPNSVAYNNNQVMLDNCGITTEYFAPVYYKVGLGVALDIPEGYDVKLYARSSTFKNFRSILLNSVGIIDEDYRGELIAGFVCYNKSYLPKIGDKICQMQLQKKDNFVLELVDELSKTERGDKGFGSTGHR